MNNPNNVTFRKTEDGNLEITLNAEGREAIAEAEQNDENIHSDGFFTALIEHQLCNGWQTVDPADIGGLTDALCLSDDTIHDDDGKLTRVGTVYTNINTYQLKSPVEIMLADGMIIFHQAR